MKQLRSLPLLVVVAVVSLVLGSVGTASAGAGLTKGKVKKIAAKVVTKAAPGLTVAKATTADNALTLAGQPPSAYQDQVAVYTASVDTPALETEWVLPLTPGVYHVSYSAYLNGSGGASGSDTACDIYSMPAPSSFYADDASFAEGSSAHSASAVLTVTAGQTYVLECFSNETWTTLAAEPVQVVVNKLDGSTSGTLTEATRPATGARGR